MRKSLALCGALALLLAACATAPVSPDQATAANARRPAGCVAGTGTLIPPKQGPTACTGFGSTYTRQDIDTTGQVDLGRALQMLDPSITRR